jgi:hypothetical protein
MGRPGGGTREVWLHKQGELLGIKLMAQPVKISGLGAGNVRIRLLGDFAIVHARFNYRSADGKQRRGHYTDHLGAPRRHLGCRIRTRHG